MELSYASVREDEYVAPPVENSIPLLIPALAPCCLGTHTTLPPMEEITEELAFICEDLNGLLREADEGRARDLCQEIGLVALCFSLNFYFSILLRLFPSMFPLLTYSQSLFSLSADHPKHTRRRRSKIRFY